MIDTSIRPETGIEQAGIEQAGIEQAGIGQSRAAAPSAPDRGRRGRRTAVRLWALLHGPALLDGPARGADDVAVVEDDRRRLAGPRGW